MPKYAAPGKPGSPVSFRDRYDHFIGGQYAPPARGDYFENPTPVTGEVFTEIARGTAEDVDHALDAAHGAARAWGRTSAAERANALTEIADRMEDDLEALAVAESWDNGKPVREALVTDIPLAIDHFRHFAAVVRAQEGGLSRIDDDLVSYHFPEPLGVVAQMIPWNFPLLTAARQLAPALAAGNAVVLKPAEQTPASIHVLLGRVADLLPPGVVNVVNGFGVEVDELLAGDRRVAKVVSAEVAIGAKSPNVFFDDVAAERDALHDKALEGFAMFAFNQGEVCASPSRALVQNGCYDEFLAAALGRTQAIRQGHPLDTETMIGALTSVEQLGKVLSYLEIGKREGARLLTGGERADLGGELSGGYYVTPTIFEGDHKMRVFQEEIFGPVLSVTGFADFDDAVKMANDTAHGLGAGVWSRNGRTAHRAAREIQAGRVWVNNYHAHRSDIGRGVLDRYQRTKNVLVSHSPDALGLF